MCESHSWPFLVGRVHFNPSANVGAHLLSVLRNVELTCATDHFSDSGDLLLKFEFALLVGLGCEIPWLTEQFAQEFSSSL